MQVTHIPGIYYHQIICTRGCLTVSCIRSSGAITRRRYRLSIISSIVVRYAAGADNLRPFTARRRRRWLSIIYYNIIIIVGTTFVQVYLRYIIYTYIHITQVYISTYFIIILQCTPQSDNTPAVFATATRLLHYYYYYVYLYVRTTTAKPMICLLPS